MLLSVMEQEQEKNVSPPFKEVDTDFLLMLSTIYFWNFIQIFINVLFIPQHFGKNLFCWYRKFPGVEFISNRLWAQTYIFGQFLKIHHSFFDLF
jgi:hypothetical protein